MLEIKLLISDLDYDAVADLVLPAVSDKLTQKGGVVGKLAGSKESLSRMAHSFLASKGQDERDQLAADIAMKKQSLIMEKAADFAKEKGLGVQIRDISVRKI